MTVNAILFNSTIDDYERMSHQLQKAFPISLAS